jgi:hypothetical protein
MNGGSAKKASEDSIAPVIASFSLMVLRLFLRMSYKVGCGLSNTDAGI